MTLLFSVFCAVRRRLFRCLFWLKLAVPWRSPIVFVFGVPSHSNLGDQAQTYCITDWVHRFLPNYQVHHITLGQAFVKMLTIRRFYKKNDILLCHSGYHFTDLYHEIDAYLAVAKLFPDAKLRIMPQTVNFINPENGQKVAEVLRQHGNCILLCRDRISYESAKKLFPECKLRLYPDVVTSLIGRIPPFNHSRKGILFCMRNDVEAFHRPEAIASLRNELAVWGDSYMTDTTLPISAEYIAAHRRQVLMKTLDMFSRYRLVITDRYHGTIFSLIAGTPVIVVNSSDHKLSSGVKWFPESFHAHVFFAPSLEEVPSLVSKIMAAGEPKPLPPYFEENFYGSKLLETLDFSENIHH